MPSANYFIYSAYLSVYCIGEVLLITCQLLADKYGKHKIQDNVAKKLMYGVYISVLMCSSLGISLHESKYHPCFGVLGATKAFLYAFFLRRARKANVVNIQTTKIWFDVIGPVYIVIYWILYVVLASIFFSGKPNDMTNENEVISWCLFSNWKWWFVILANTVDVINCVVTLLLFLYPLLQSVNRLKTNDSTNSILLLKFISTMKWNVCLSFIATISSIAFLVAVPIVKEYIWFFCAGDPFINSICVFLMTASNRNFCKNRFCKQCRNRDESHSVRHSRAQSNNEITNTKVSYNMNPMNITSAVAPPIVIETRFETKSGKKKGTLSTLAASFVQSTSNQLPKRAMSFPAIKLQASRSY